MANEYWVVGPDGREYGPASFETLREWIEVGRVVPTTLVRTAEVPVAEARMFPELAPCFAIETPETPPPFPQATPIPAEFRAWGFIEQAWGLVKDNWLPFAAMFFIQTAMFAVPYIGPIVAFFIAGAIHVGIWRAVLGRIDGRRPSVGMMFEGFDRFADAFLATLVIAILVSIGFVFLIVPGIILSIIWIFTLPVLAETKLGFWRAMDESVALTKGYRMELFLLGLASILILLLGLLACCIGVFVAQPVVYMAFGLAYRFLVARRQAAAATV
jgi:uncharacterized membrane protein